MGQSAEAEGALGPKGISIADRMNVMGPIVASCVSILTVLVLLGTLCVLFVQGRTLVRQADILEETVAQAKDATEQTLAQSRRSLETTIEIARNDQRAWVGPVDMSASEIKEGSRLRVSIPLSNSGRSPANKVNVELGSSVNLRGEPFKAEYRRTTGTGIQSIAVIQPSARQDINGVCDGLFTEEEVSGIASETRLLVVYGRISYEDAFGRGCETKFAYRWVPSISKWRALDTYNTAK